MIAEDKKQTVMIVDDKPINIRILCEAFRDEYAIVFATSGREALDMAEKTHPDLILLDIMMPEMNGYDVCRSIKLDPFLNQIPVIFITAMSQQEDEISGLQLGAVDYITKPFNPDIVRLRVRTHLELKKYRDLHARIALQDGLTGIPNRRSFDETLMREWQRARRNASELSLVMIDIDHFKSYNDSYGHLAGDDCLRRVTAAVAQSLRVTDYLARYGGEEFACILPDTGEEGALISAERIRCHVASASIPHGASPVAPHVTVSLGIASMVPSEKMAPESLIEMADRMLYRAKDGGRNRVGQWRPDRVDPDAPGPAAMVPTAG
jgi:diguanylate cyclase (GGDEF)-like protein